MTHLRALCVTSVRHHQSQCLLQVLLLRLRSGGVQLAVAGGVLTVVVVTLRRLHELLVFLLFQAVSHNRVKAGVLIGARKVGRARQGQQTDVKGSNVEVKAYNHDACTVFLHF